jgi:hypothetical protein
MRAFGIPWLVVVGAAAEEGAGYRFVPGVPVALAYEMRQEVDWSSGGDRLAYATEQAWQCFLTATAVAPERVDLQLTVTRVVAKHQGAGRTQVFDSSAGEAGEPPLGHLGALVGTPIDLVVDPRSGRVLSARGGDALVERIDRLAPSKEPGEPGPLRAAAQAAFSDAAISRIAESWLRLPGSATEAYPLLPPLSGSAVRTWSGNTYSVALPAGATAAPLVLGEGAAAVTGRLAALSGEGRVLPERGVPARAEGRWRFTLELAALTQPATAVHTLTWRMLPATPVR